MSLTMVHANPATIDDGVFKVDRKFHVGMEAYARSLGRRLLTVHPQRPAGQPIMDPVEIPCDSLPYDVLIIKTDAAFRPLPGELDRLAEVIGKSRWVYGTALGSARLARRLGVPYTSVLEYDLLTQVTVAATQVSGRVRRLLRAARCVGKYLTDGIPEMRHAKSLHCNGYPIFEVARGYNRQCLLYLDSRMSAEMIIDEAELRTRLADRPSQALRLLYSGRYERLKGADDAVRVAVSCLARGIEIEMHCYGQGSLRSAMEDIARSASRPGRIFIHDAVPYSELVTISRNFDLFVCCHIQSDPSCTYLESFGAGLPVVGYANRMWRGLCENSGAGLISPMNQPEKIVDAIESLLRDPALLAQMSHKARDFALLHTFEREFQRRIDALSSHLA